MQDATEHSSSATLGTFLATHPGALKVASVLKPGAEVGVRFTDEPGEWRLHVPEAGKVRFEPGAATDPDFELQLPPAALQSIVSRPQADVGDLGIAFFEHIAAKDAARHIGLKIQSGVVKLTRRGWLGVLPLGGTKVMMWLAGKGLRGGGAIASALGRFKG